MIPNNPKVGWAPLNTEAIWSVPASVGVYQIAGQDQIIVDIGYGGGRSLFGIRGEIMEWVGREGSWLFRYEVTTAYLSRFNELALLYKANHGVLPREVENRGVLVRGYLQP